MRLVLWSAFGSGTIVPRLCQELLYHCRCGAINHSMFRCHCIPIWVKIHRARFVFFQSEADEGVHLPYDLDITFLDMERFLVTAWRLARSTVAGRWRGLNSRFFGGGACALPNLYSPTSPYGHAPEEEQAIGQPRCAAQISRGTRSNSVIRDGRRAMPITTRGELLALEPDVMSMLTRTQRPAGVARGSQCS
jgi:hypothetical protein